MRPKVAEEGAGRGIFTKGLKRLPTGNLVMSPWPPDGNGIPFNKTLSKFPQYFSYQPHLSVLHRGSRQYNDTYHPRPNSQIPAYLVPKEFGCPPPDFFLIVSAPTGLRLPRRSRSG